MNNLRDEAIEAAYLSANDRFDLSFEEFVFACSFFNVEPVLFGKKVIGALISFENEIHACILPQFKCRWVRKKHFRILNEIIDKYGYAKTTATTKEGEDFVLMLGFVRHEGIEYRSNKKWELKH